MTRNIHPHYIGVYLLFVMELLQILLLKELMRTCTDNKVKIDYAEKKYFTLHTVTDIGESAEQLKGKTIFLKTRKICKALETPLTFNLL